MVDCRYREQPLHRCRSRECVVVEGDYKLRTCADRRGERIPNSLLMKTRARDSSIRPKHVEKTSPDGAHSLVWPVGNHLMIWE